MKSKIFYLVIIFIFILIINIFFKISLDTYSSIIGINIVIIINILILFLCVIATNILLKKSKIDKNNFKMSLANYISNSFIINSVITIFSSIVIYGFFKDILNLFNIRIGIVNFAVYSAKIWFISMPIMGIEITILKYFHIIEYIKKPVIILISKIILYCILSFILYFKYNYSCVIYAKPICDAIFLIYYSKICFDLTMKN